VERLLTNPNGILVLPEHLAIIGTSKGAEAALLLAARDPRIKTVAALSPTSVVWANVGAGSDGAITPPRSSWTAAGQPLPFVPHDPTWNMSHAGQPPAYRGLYEQSLTTYAERVETATIPVERISADVLLTAGGDDQVWPATEFADRIVTRRRRHDLPTRLLKNAGAGHRVLLPAEPRSASGEINLARGGTRQADDALGRQLWRELQHLLDLEPGE
jgi:alpha-beta hydrolase superfamily lysophospholipase